MIEIFDNIRKIYRFAEACPPLNPFIEFFSETSPEERDQFSGKEEFTVTMFPSFTPTFYINLGAPYQVVTSGNNYSVKPKVDILILRDSIVHLHKHPADHVLTVKFYPGGLESILGIDQTQFAGKVINLSDILPQKLIAQVKSLPRFEDRIHLLEQYFISRLHNQKTKDHYLYFVKDTINMYSATDMRLNNNELAERMFTSSKTIHRYFNAVIGTSPKQYFSIIRARTALTNYVANRKNFDPALHGYYDMSHFHKHILAFTGFTPAHRDN